MATITCQCGKVCIEFPTTKPRCTQECCCNDCFARIDYLHKQGGPTMPDEIQKRLKPTTFHYFVNRLQVKSGKDQIKFFLLSDNGDNYNMATKCCNTFLLGHSLKFSGNGVAVPVELNTLSDNVIAEKPLLRWFPADLAVEESNGINNDDSNIPPRAWLNSEFAPEGTDGFADNFGVVMGAWTKPVADEENVGETFVDLLNTYKARDGNAVEIVSAST